jgi:pilus assembly protein Flp/PilA
MRNFIFSLMRDERGQDLIEYGLVAALIAILCIAAITGAGQKISTWYDTVEFNVP